MVAVEIIPLLIQVAIAFAACLVFLFIGMMLCSFFTSSSREAISSNKHIFYALLAGMLFVVTLYAIAISGLKTIYLLLLPAAVVCFGKKIVWKRFVFPKINWTSILEVLILGVGFALVLNILPESENKQRDSFYYLKISEALNLSGQENTNNYYNLLSGEYHGVEMYHYFESWLNALLLNFTESILSNIQTFRIVTFTIISIVFCYGLFYTYELLAGKRPGLIEKLFCLCFVFFSPDLFFYLPDSVTYYLVYNFESNYLERPNFRLIYLFLVPVLTELLAGRVNDRFIFFLICFCLVNPTVIAMVVPAFLILAAYQFFVLKNPQRWIVQKKELAIFFVFVLVYIAFYGWLSVRHVPPMYETGFQRAVDYYGQSWRFVLLTIVTGILYVGMFLAIAWFIYYRATRDLTVVKHNKPLLAVAGLFVVCGIFIGRVFIYIENLVQVAFNGYIVVSLLLFMLFIPVVKKSWRFLFFAVIVFIGSYFLHKAYGERTKSLVFDQNDRLAYSGKPYSKEYLDSVISFARGRKSLIGGFIADSLFYQRLSHYGLRNPNVYHLPVTYVLSNFIRVNDFCLSDPRAIKYDSLGKFKENSYLNNAISRSYYHRSVSSYSFSDDKTLLQLGDFIMKNKLQYLGLTAGVSIDSIPGVHFTHKFSDPNTKERFWVVD